MTGSSAALDANQVIAFFNGEERMREWVESLPAIYLPVIVIGELRFGALKSGRVASNLSNISSFINRCTILPVSEATTMHYARIKLALRVAGTPIPENDVWIAACCLEHNLPLATADAHFDQVSGLRTIDTGF